MTNRRPLTAPYVPFGIYKKTLDKYISKICRVQYTTPNPIVKEPMYAARRRQKSVRGKFQFGKLRIGQKFQFFDNALRQLP